MWKVKTCVNAECRESLTQSFAGPRDVPLDVFEKGLEFAVSALRTKEVSILGLEISDLLAIQDCACKGLSFRSHAHLRRVLTWRQAFKQLPHGHFHIMRFDKVRGAIFHFNEGIGSPCMHGLGPVKIQRTEILVLTHPV
jgi:hypothetical protein